MKCILMNQNTPIMAIEYNTTLNAIEEMNDYYWGLLL